MTPYPEALSGMRHGDTIQRKLFNLKFHNALPYHSPSFVCENVKSFLENLGSFLRLNNLEWCAALETMRVFVNYIRDRGVLRGKQHYERVAKTTKGNEKKKTIIVKSQGQLNKTKDFLVYK